MAECHYCDGVDYTHITASKGNGRCRKCHGEGQVVTDGGILSAMVVHGIDDAFSPCPSCSPDGHDRGNGQCQECGGTGFLYGHDNSFNDEDEDIYYSGSGGGASGGSGGGNTHAADHGSIYHKEDTYNNTWFWHSKRWDFIQQFATYVSGYLLIRFCYNENRPADMKFYQTWMHADPYMKWFAVTMWAISLIAILIEAKQIRLWTLILCILSIFATFKRGAEMLHIHLFTKATFYYINENNQNTILPSKCSRIEKGTDGSFYFKIPS